MHSGRVGVVEQRQGAIGGDRLVALAQLLGGAGELAVRGRDQRIDGQEPARVPRQALPVAGRLVQLHQPQVGRARVAVARRQLLEDRAFRGGIGQVVW